MTWTWLQSDRVGDKRLAPAMHIYRTQDPGPVVHESCEDTGMMGMKCDTGGRCREADGQRCRRSVLRAVIASSVDHFSYSCQELSWKIFLRINRSTGDQRREYTYQDRAPCQRGTQPVSGRRHRCPRPRSRIRRTYRATRQMEEALSLYHPETIHNHFKFGGSVRCA